MQTPSRYFGNILSSTGLHGGAFTKCRRFLHLAREEVISSGVELFLEEPLHCLVSWRDALPATMVLRWLFTGQQFAFPRVTGN
jgi:hypothetical protein